MRIFWAALLLQGLQPLSSAQDAHFAATSRGAVKSLAAAGPRKVRVVSDIHAGSCWATNATKLFEFLEQTARDGIDALVLNGDIFDFWLIPLNATPHSIDTMSRQGIDANGFDMSTFRRLLNKAAGSVQLVHEGPGNHDMWMSEALAEKILDLPHVDWPADDQRYRDWGVGFEHGHEHTLYNQGVPGTTLMPIGYFVTRAVSSYACVSQSRISQFLEGAIRTLLGTRVLDALAVDLLLLPGVFPRLLKTILMSASASHLPDDLNVPVVGVLSPDALPVSEAAASNYTLAQFVSNYSSALEKFVAKYGKAQVARYMLGDIDARSLDYNIARGSVTESMVVLGHTHEPRMELVARENGSLSNTPDVLLVNAGAWVADDSGQSHASYLDITIDDIAEDFDECYTQANGSDYRGRVHKGKDGNDCWGWGGELPEGSRYYNAFGGVAFCRNLGDATAPWCYTGTVSWAYCSVGSPQRTCEKKMLRGAVKAELRRYEREAPLGVAWRNASTGSRWSVNGTAKKTRGASEFAREYRQDEIVI
eukprot:TRINITY_DN15950_c0_g1_i1.p1 TRINITY_DN15950_c0_g1~~TRINITY_DN15950_c0_g1_i1.p1  ORF type:complete len:535 (-),score=79.90 TRINITY_DN15950_c0_g1_i1:584-2188(-)